MKTHINHVFAKTGLRDRAQLVTYATTGIARAPSRLRRGQGSGLACALSATSGPSAEGPLGVMTNCSVRDCKPALTVMRLGGGWEDQSSTRSEEPT